MTGHIAWNRGIDSRKKFICKNCGKEFLSYGNRKYCSKSCIFKNRKMSKEHKRKISKALKGNKNGRFGKGKIISKDVRNRTSKTLKLMYKLHPEKREFLRQKRYKQKRVYESQPEKIFQEVLKKNNIKFKKHQYIKIKHPYQCDIFIKPNIVIEIDGDYWHDLPQNKKKDEIRNKEMKEKGLRVFRIRTSKFLDKYYKLNKDNIDKILSQIKNATR
jgi:very-short-patch-repair endonuclease